MAVLGLSLGVMGQGVLSGTVLDQEAGMALPGAAIFESGTTNGTITGLDGTFQLNTTAQTGTIVISFLGYISQTLDFDLANATGVGELVLELDAKTMDEVVIIGYGVIDVAKDRETPVAVSTIKLPEIDQFNGMLL